MLLSERAWISNCLLHGDDGDGNRTPGAHVLLWSMSSHDDVHDDVRENLHNGIHDDVRENVSFLP